MNDRQAIHVTLAIQMSASQPTGAATFLAHADVFMEQLMEIEVRDTEISDSTVGADAGTGEINVEMLVFTDDSLHAMMTALTAIRTAMHAAGAGTPGWPDVDQIARTISAANVQTQRTLVPA